MALFKLIYVANLSTNHSFWLLTSNPTKYKVKVMHISLLTSSKQAKKYIREEERDLGIITTVT